MLFAQKGEDATTTKEIATLAKTSEGNIYRHFESKKDLAERLFEQQAAAFYQFLVDESHNKEEPRLKLEALVGGIFGFAKLHRPTFDYLLSVHHTGVIRGRTSSNIPLPIHLFSKTIQEGIKCGQFKEIDAVLGSGWIVAMAQRTVILLDTKLLVSDADTAIAKTIESALLLLKRPSIHD